MGSEVRDAALETAREMVGRARLSVAKAHRVISEARREVAEHHAAMQAMRAESSGTGPRGRADE